MMTSRERWLAAVRMQPVDRLPFWPKLNASYPRAQKAPFNDMGIDAIHDWIGSDVHVGVGRGIREIRKKTSHKTSREGNVQRTVYTTRFATLQAMSKFNVPSQSWHPVEFPVKTLDDVKIAIEFYSDCSYEVDGEGLEQARARATALGETGVTHSGVGTSPLMYWVEHLAGVETAHLLLLQHPEEVSALFDAMSGALLRATEIVAEHCPADLIYFTENTSTTLISPAQYREYNLPQLRPCVEILKSRNRLVVLHMCGLLKALLPDIDTLPVDAFEAFTSPPLANTTLLDGRTGCPNKCLIGGTNAILWTKPAPRIIEQLEKDLAELPHHRGVVVTSAGVMPPLASPETIRKVCDWVKAYVPRM